MHFLKPLLAVSAKQPISPARLSKVPMHLSQPIRPTALTIRNRDTVRPKEDRTRLHDLSQIALPLINNAETADRSSA